MATETGPQPTPNAPIRPQALLAGAAGELLSMVKTPLAASQNLGSAITSPGLRTPLLVAFKFCQYTLHVRSSLVFPYTFQPDACGSLARMLRLNTTTHPKI